MDLHKKSKKGQALLIVLLAMAALTTIVLSIVSRSISQVEITNREEESIRAFSAAEAGLEEALVKANIGTNISSDLEVDTADGNSTATVGTYSANVTSFPEVSSEFFYPIEMASGEIATIWFVSVDNNNELPCTTDTPCYTDPTITLCWGQDPSTGLAMDASHADAPALSLSFLYLDSANNLIVTKANYDPKNGRTLENNFDLANTAGTCTIEDQEYGFSQNIVLGAGGLDLPITTPGRIKYMRVKMLYNTGSDQTFGVSSAGGNFPAQGKKVTSTGRSGNATRKIEAYLLNPAMPTIFESAIYSPQGIVKN